MPAELGDYPRVSLVASVIIERASADEKRGNRLSPLLWFFTEWDRDHWKILSRKKGKI